MAAKKTVKKAADATPAKKAMPAKVEKKVPAQQTPVKKPAGPTARTCPLVLDGEIDAEDFSPSDCLTCSEFDCRFCEAEEGSGALRSRLSARGDDADDDGDDGWGSDFDAEGESEGEDEDEGEEDEEPV